MEWLEKFWSDETGATMPEYALMVGLIAFVAFASVAILGVNIKNFFNDAAIMFQ